MTHSLAIQKLVGTFAALAIVTMASAQFQRNQTVKVTQLDDGRQIRLSTGQMLQISLPAQPSTGYSWYIVENNPALLQQVGPVQFNANTAAIGTRGTQVFQFRAMSGGGEALRLAYGQQWDTRNPPTDRFTLLVSVDQHGIPDTVRINERFNHRDITIEVGDRLMVELESNPSTGYRWSITRTSPFVITPNGENYVPPKNNRPGAPGKQVFIFTGYRPGTVSLTLSYIGPSGQVGKTFDVNVRVQSVANPRPQPGWPGASGPGQGISGGKGQGWGGGRGG